MRWLARRPGSSRARRQLAERKCPALLANRPAASTWRHVHAATLGGASALRMSARQSPPTQAPSGFTSSSHGAWATSGRSSATLTAAANPKFLASITSCAPACRAADTELSDEPASTTTIVTASAPGAVRTERTSFPTTCPWSCVTTMAATNGECVHYLPTAPRARCRTGSTSANRHDTVCTAANQGTIKVSVIATIAMVISADS